MGITNCEFKAKVVDLSKIEAKLLTLQPVFQGEDRQIDTYFDVPNGRLKLRTGNLENSLIYYERADLAGDKISRILLHHFEKNDENLLAILKKTLRVKVVVDKLRKIYFLGNVKIHLDFLSELGSFLEVEAIDAKGDIPQSELKAQCAWFIEFFDIQATDFIEKSYSDLILSLKS